VRLKGKATRRLNQKGVQVEHTCRGSKSVIRQWESFFSTRRTSVPKLYTNCVLVGRAHALYRTTFPCHFFASLHFPFPPLSFLILVTTPLQDTRYPRKQSSAATPHEICWRLTHFDWGTLATSPSKKGTCLRLGTGRRDGPYFSVNSSKSKL
jgi:hypothetical protein